MDNPTVSVILTNYNYGSYIEEAIEGVLNQTYTDYEFIIVDDGSTDDSIQRIQPYLSHPNVRLVQHKENKGVFFTLTNGYKNSKGKYLAFTSSDDLLFKTYLEENITALENHPELGLACSKYAYFYTEDKEKITSIDLLKKNTPHVLRPNMLAKVIRRKKFWIPGNATVVRREAFEKAGGHNPKYSSYTDWFLFTKIGLMHGIYYIPNTIAAMRKHQSAFSVTRPASQKHEAWQSMINFLNQTENKKIKKSFLKSHSFYHFDIDFFHFMLKNPRHWFFFTSHLWVRFLCLWLKKNNKAKKRVSA